MYNIDTLLGDNIKLYDDKCVNSKASEKYVHVVFNYPSDNYVWDGWVPIEYRRTGVSVKNNIQLADRLNSIYEDMRPQKRKKWLAEQEIFWNAKSNALVTREFFDILASGGWKCTKCDFPENRNYARRIQTIKEYGYTISTDLRRFCPRCNSKLSHLIMLPIPRVELAGNGYETWSTKLRKKIIESLGKIDVYENRYDSNCLPDHKFSEIRWDDDTKSNNDDNMSISEIKDKFQLLTNQRNQQKREVCRECYQSGKRGTIFGINFFYYGNEYWNDEIPQKGKDAEKGCIGCPWYDIDKWRKELNNYLSKGGKL